MARRGDAADGDGDGDRPGSGRHHVVVHAGQEPLGGDRHVVGRAVAQHQAELVAGKTAERVLAAHAAADAPGDRADHLVGDVETVGLVDAGDVVDGDQHEAARRAQPDRFVDGVFQHFGQMVPVQLAGEPVVAGQIGEPPHVLVALVDDADDAVGAHRLAVRAGEPAADILDPQPRVRCRVGTDAILNLIGDAAAVVALVRLHDGVEARLGVLGLEHLGIGAAGRDRGDVGDQQHRGGVGAPMQRVGVDAPVVGHLADRVEDFGRVDADPVRCAGRDRIARTGVGQSRLIGIVASDKNAVARPS